MARKAKSSTPEPVASATRESEPAIVQSGDLQGLTDDAGADSESVRELLEEGQAYEAMLVNSIENAEPGPVRTRQVREDDVPPEYTDRDPDEPKEE